MADITSGHGKALEADGMTAGHRHQPGIQIDIPGLRSANVGLADLDITSQLTAR